MRAITHEQKILAIGMLWCIVTCGIYVYAFLHQHNMQLMLEEERATLALKRAESQSHARTKESAQALEAMWEELVDHVVSIDLPSGFLGELETILSSFGLTFDTTLTQREEADASGVARVLEVVLSVAGSKEKIFAALAALEQLSYVSSVEGFSLDGSEDVTGEFWNGTIRIQAMAR